MIVIDGYSIDYHPSSNRIEIILPQTMRTFTNTVSTLKKRLVDVKECELSAILIVAKSMIEGERRMKTRYINADDAIYELKRAFPVEDFNKIIRVISRTPTANVVERKRGRWEVAIGYDPKRSVMCSECRRMAYEPTPFCPNCGAEMRGEEG